MKKLVGIIAILLGIVALVQVINKTTSNDDNVSNSPKSIFETYKTEVIVYGDEILLDEGCVVRQIDNISNENIIPTSDFQYTFLILNDIDGELDLSDESILTIKENIDNNGLRMFYFGKDYLDKFVELGVFHQPFLEPDMSLGVVFERNIKTEVVGTWTEELNEMYLSGDTELLIEMIMFEITDTIKVDNM